MTERPIPGGEYCPWCHANLMGAPLPEGHRLRKLGHVAWRRAASVRPSDEPVWRCLDCGREFFPMTGYDPLAAVTITRGVRAN